MHEHPTEAANVQVGPTPPSPPSLLPTLRHTSFSSFRGCTAGREKPFESPSALIGSLRSRSADLRICFSLLRKASVKWDFVPGRPHVGRTIPTKACQLHNFFFSKCHLLLVKHCRTHERDVCWEKMQSCCRYVLTD